jgi:hypothetical protein
MARTGAWILKTVAAIGFAAVFATASYLSARQSFRPPPADPSFLDIARWALSSRDPFALITALLAGLGALASVYQLFGPQPARASLVKRLFAVHRRHQNASFQAADARADERQAELRKTIASADAAGQERDSKLAEQMEQLIRLASIQQDREIQIDISIRIKPGDGK